MQRLYSVLVSSFVISSAFGAGTPLEGWKAVKGAAALDAAVLHGKSNSLRVEPGADREARVELAAVRLIAGQRYELAGWIRTSGVEVRDTARSPIALGAAISMASMPFDLRSRSLAGTHDWTEVRLPFTATSSSDRIALTVGNGGAFRGQAWFADLRIDGPGAAHTWPTADAVKTFGPAYRYPDGGWIYLHIQGAPYERGYQHGFLMSHEIETYLDRCAAQIDPRSRKEAWAWGRTTTNALFLRGFDQEILQEMKGIADGAAAAGAKYDGRRVDLIDIVAANTITELGELRSAMPMTPTGLETLHLEPPSYFDRKRDVPVTERCSAFCATGKATRDGRMIIAHITMWPLTLAEQTNVMLDIQPATGHRMLIQGYPGGIQSGTDWYQNDAGIVITETTIRQSPFNVNGTPVAYRARKAIQYGDSVDKVVEYLGTKNNGLYTNEWLIGDAKNNEIAMYELGTYKTKLYRSSKNEWFGGTEGFYWGDNNAKDLAVRLEYAPDPKGDHQHIPYTASERDVTWQNLYERYRGRMDQEFAFTAFRTAPLVTSTAMDAKVATAEMAEHQMVWATFGKPNQREWVPSPGQKRSFPENQGLYPGGYRLFSAVASSELQKIVQQREQERLSAKDKDTPEKKVSKRNPYEDRLWKGWILPANPDDTWLTSGAAAYSRALRGGTKDLAKTLERYRAGFRSAAVADSNEMHRFAQATYKGALLLDALRAQLGDDRFFDFMKNFFGTHTTKSVTTAQFRQGAGPETQALFDRWLGTTGLPGDGGGPLYTPADLHPMSSRLRNTVIVYGTVAEAGSNRYAAEQLQTKFLDWFEEQVPVLRDFEITDDLLRDREVVFVGRPETNSALAQWQSKLGFSYDRGVFRIDGKTYASERDALALAMANPLNRKHLVVVLAGNSPLETVRLAMGSLPATQWAVFRDGKETVSGFLR